MDQLVPSVGNWRFWLPFPSVAKFGANGKFPTARNQKYGKSSRSFHGSLAFFSVSDPPDQKFLVPQPGSWLARMNTGDQRCHAKKYATVTVLYRHNTSNVFAFVVGLFGVKLRELLGRC